MKNIFYPHKLPASGSTSGRLPAQEYRPLGDFLDRRAYPTFSDPRFTQHKKIGL